jgi:DNA polymerase I-like protein with 3'-5' exonuclease and polymerase domains
MHIDTKALIALRKEVADGITLHESYLKDMLGWVPNTKSAIDMARLMAQYNIPIRERTKTGKVQIRKETLLTYGNRHPIVRPALTECLEITRRRTLASNFLGMALDRNDYYHPVYRLNGTKTGRFASEGADEGGPQGQNWPFHLRNIVIPDEPGDELTSADLKQAEAMFVAYDSRDVWWIRIFESHKDGHGALALVLFHGADYAKLPSDAEIQTISKVCPTCDKENLKECTHSERFISKSSGYAFKYGMGARKYITKQLPPAGVFMSEAEGKRIRNKVITPALGRWQHRGYEELRESRWVTNALGRRREFYGILDDSGDLVRELLSWKAQSVINVITSRAMILLQRIFVKIKGASNLPLPRIITTTHDSVLINARRALRRDIHDACDEVYQQPIPLHGRTLTIPLDKGSGANWRDAK